MEWVGCIRCEKFQNDFMAQTCALIAPVQPVLQRVSSSNETLPNAPNHYETHQNMSFGSNGGGSIPFIAKNSDATSRNQLFALVVPIQPVLYRASCSNKTIQNASKHYETHQNMSLGPGWIGCIRCKKFRCDFVAKTFALIAPVQPVLH